MKIFLYLNGTLLPNNYDESRNSMKSAIDDAKAIQRANKEPLTLEIKDEHDRTLWRS